jgi:hypothetical protein
MPVCEERGGRCAELGDAIFPCALCHVPGRTMSEFDDADDLFLTPYRTGGRDRSRVSRRGRGARRRLGWLSGHHGPCEGDQGCEGPTGAARRRDPSPSKRKSPTARMNA